MNSAAKLKNWSSGGGGDPKIIKRAVYIKKWFNIQLRGDTEGGKNLGS